MNRNTLIFLIIYLLINISLSAQDINKMNKTELRDQLSILSSRIDYFKIEIIFIRESESKLSQNITSLNYKNKANDNEIKTLNDLIKANITEKNRLISENEMSILKLNNDIISLKDSVSNILKHPNSVTINQTQIEDDFLNKYYFNQIPLNNNTFSLVLTKLVYGNRANNYNNETLNNLPEILEANSFYFKN
jgi:hypothetical protein